MDKFTRVITLVFLVLMLFALGTAWRSDSPVADPTNSPAAAEEAKAEAAQTTDLPQLDDPKKRLGAVEAAQAEAVRAKADCEKQLAEAKEALQKAQAEAAEAKAKAEALRKAAMPSPHAPAPKK
jgi:hypothetical protein